MNIIEQLKNRYPDPLDENNPFVDINKKWGSFIGKGWYGESGLPKSWTCIIDDFLEYLRYELKTFEIHQIKLKFGGLRFYVIFETGVPAENDRICAEINELEKWLFDKSLIY